MPQPSQVTKAYYKSLHGFITELEISLFTTVFAYAKQEYSMWRKIGGLLVASQS